MTDPYAGQWLLDDDGEPWFNRRNDSTVYRLDDLNYDEATDHPDYIAGSVEAKAALVDLVRRDRTPDPTAEQPECPGCSHAGHYGIRCASTTDEGRHMCACNYPRYDNYEWTPEVPS